MGITVEVKKKLGEFCLDIRFQSEASRIGILGASGCGKSMTLKSIAGIESPDEGEIVINDHVVFDSRQKVNIKPQKRNIGYLFQNYALFPTMTVNRNIAAGLKGTRQEKQERVQEMIRRFQLEGLEERLPGELSGGQQQRVALARIMAYEPDVILLDEPFSALDMFLKDRLQQELMEMLEGYHGIVVMVSHNRDEIYRFSEDLLILDQGRVVTSGKTRDIFDHPRRKAAARLTGCKNFSRAKRLDEHTVKALDWGVELKTRNRIPEDTTWIGFRAHEFLPIWGERIENCIRVQVAGTADLPFEKNFYLKPETEQLQDVRAENICWFLQKDKRDLLSEKGMPDYLQFPEEYLLFLTDDC